MLVKLEYHAQSGKASVIINQKKEQTNFNYFNRLKIKLNEVNLSFYRVKFIKENYANIFYDSHPLVTYIMIYNMPSPAHNLIKRKKEILN
jgi:hypothetical protein